MVLLFFGLGVSCRLILLSALPCRPPGYSELLRTGTVLQHVRCCLHIAQTRALRGYRMLLVRDFLYELQLDLCAQVPWRDIEQFGHRQRLVPRSRRFLFDLTGVDNIYCLVRQVRLPGLFAM